MSAFNYDNAAVDLWNSDPYAVADNGTVSGDGTWTPPAWTNFLFDTADRVAGIVSQFNNQGSGGSPAVPTAAQTAAIERAKITAWLPWILGGVAVLLLGGFLILRSK